MGLLDVNENGGEQSSGLTWVVVGLFAYFILVLIYAGFVASPDELRDRLSSERVSNQQLFSKIDESSWERVFSDDGRYIRIITEYLANELSNRKSIANDDKFIENNMRESNVGLTYIGIYLDYRIQIMINLLPLFLIILVGAVIDGAMVRKVNTYKNSFASPLRHFFGGQVLGLHTTIVIIILLFFPYTIPLYVFIILFLIKIVGWWIWTAYLPKRM